MSGSKNLAAALLDGVTMAPVTVGEALRSLAIVGDRLRARGDSRAIFPDVYAIITRRVRDSIDGAARRMFVEPQFISRLAGRFCELYLAALRRSLVGEREGGAAWERAFREKDSPRLFPVQHALLGLNAHINFDLAIGLFANVTGLSAANDAVKMERFHRDHDAVNEILEEALPEVLTLLAERHGCPLSRAILRTDEPRRALSRATIFTLRTWRARVWDEMVEMLSAPDPVGRAHVQARMDLRSGLFARALAVPTPLALHRFPALAAAA